MSLFSTSRFSDKIGCILNFFLKRCTLSSGSPNASIPNLEAKKFLMHKLEKKIKAHYITPEVRLRCNNLLETYDCRYVGTRKFLPLSTPTSAKTSEKHRHLCWFTLHRAGLISLHSRTSILTYKLRAVKS